MQPSEMTLQSWSRNVYIVIFVIQLLRIPMQGSYYKPSHT